MLINEIFYSISGESINSGFPTIFIRTFGCNLRCSYCDSMYAVEGDDYKEMSVDEILSEISNYLCHRVIFTGGEPLIQKDAYELINRLASDGYSVEIETNGAVPLYPMDFMNPLITITMDWKCPSSGMTDKMISENLSILGKRDVVKCVVGSTEDLYEMKRISKLTRAQVFVSPIFGKIEPKEIVEYLLDNNLTNVRFQLQIHKFVWPVDQRGV